MPCLFVFLAAVCPLCSLRPVDLQSPVSRPDHGRTSVIRHELAQTTVGMDEFRQQQLEMLTRPRPSSPSSTPSAANAASALHLGEHPGTSKTGLASWSYATHKLSLSLFLSCLLLPSLSRSLSLTLSRSLSLARAVPYKHTQAHTNTHTVPLSQTAGRALPPSEREARPEMQPGAGSYSSYNLTFVQS